jgi:hypothetical protein
MSQERRDFHRIPLHRTATLSRTGELPETVRVQNLSLKGVLFDLPASAPPAKSGEKARLRLSLNDEFQIDMNIEMLYCHRTHVGARWHQIDVDSLVHLRQLIALNLGDAARVDEELAKVVKNR